MASTSCAKQSPLPMKEPPSTCQPAPRYEDIVASPELFMSTLEKLHATMGTKFMIPIIGGKELDLYRLFVEVTSRGGVEKIIKEKRWKEVTAVFNFPSTATNASFVLRKYYVSLLHEYEQIYYFRSQDFWQSPSAAPIPAQGTVQPSTDVQAPVIQQPKIRPASTSGYPVIGVIDGKFESGYLVTVTIGSEKLKGVLYESPQDPVQLVQPSHNLHASANACAVAGVQRRRRRKKSEIKRRDPAHPKPNRSGYNFFFAEQHARLKPLHPGKDREISRMIGELWTTISESEKAVYQEKALKDKERYRIEMEDYRERLRTGQVISDAIPPQQSLPGQEVGVLEAETKLDKTAEDSPQTPEIDSSSGESDFEDDKTAEKDLDISASQVVEVGAECGNFGIDVSAVEHPFKRAKIDDNVGHNIDSVGENIMRVGLVEKAGNEGGESISLI
ncbi:high mobility group B protein 15-like isoform X2 [Mangifera indica]|uniref:high mobility group B protein 15-like isoform X2 n=1 Tax=Mangifera indica TaxID=29780 RepID=UPI001CFBD63D|nr:high mobility group B protein 15-like isoform X2 [Mangifera indica]